MSALNTKEDNVTVPVAVASDIADQESRKKRTQENVKTAVKIIGFTAVCGVIGAQLAKRSAEKEDELLLYGTKVKKGSTTPPDVHAAAKKLAFKALGYGTVLAVAGVSAISYGFWLWSGATHLKELKTKVREKLPGFVLREPVIDETSNIQTWEELRDYLGKKDKR